MSETSIYTHRPEAITYTDIYRLPIIAELAARVDIVREGGIPPLTIDRRWADISEANIEHYNLRTDVETPGSSFKARGAYTAVRAAVLEGGHTHIGTASAGNHAQGIASAVKQFSAQGVTAKIWMPKNTPARKVSGVRSFDPAGHYLDIDMTSPTFDQADKVAQAASDTYYYISPFDNYDVIAGQGTVATEALAEHPDTDKLFVTVGGGGLLAGTLESVASMKAAGMVNPNLTVVAVMLQGNDSLLQTLQYGTPSPATQLDTLTEGAAVSQIGDIPARLIHEHQDHLELLIVTRDDMAETQYHLANRTQTYPPDEMTSLLPQTGARVLAKSRTRYSEKQKWLTMTTGTNISEEKTHLLQDHYRRIAQSRQAMLRSFGHASVKPVVAPSEPRSANAKYRTGKSVASGYILR